MKKIIIIVTILVIIGMGLYFLFLMQDSSESRDVAENLGNAEGGVAATTTVEEPIVEVPEVVDDTKTVIGSSVEGNEITAYHYGEGDTELLFVGGIHGGYSWNTVLVAYELMDYLEANPDIIPETVKVTVLPVLNPDGLNAVVGSTGRFTKADVPSKETERIPGRFNAHEVDLNRNFDCDWQETGTWKSAAVSGGDAPFSEPESQAFKQYIDANSPSAVVVWYSAVGGVFASNCHNGILAETSVLTNLYANASGYQAYEDFDFYEITGDAVNWLAKNNVPAISVLLTTHEDTDWTQNLAGIEALFAHYTTE